MANRLGDIERILKGLEEIDEKYLFRREESCQARKNLPKEYIQAMNSIRSLLAFEILLKEEIEMAKTGERTIIGGRYWNAKYYATAIVAVVTEGIDWAAYISGVPVDIQEHEAMEFVAQWGCKLSEKDATHYFPKITLPYRY